MQERRDLEQAKKEAAAKAKAAALAKKKAKETGDTANLDEETKAKQKAAAAAKAKAAALAKKKAKETGDTANLDEETKAKQKAAAAAKAKAAALAKKKAKETGDTANLDEETKAKQKAAAAAKAKAAALAKKKAKETGDTADLDEETKAKQKAAAAAKAKALALSEAKLKASSHNMDSINSEIEIIPSLNQPYLEKYVKEIEEALGSDIIEESYINGLSKDVPTLVVKKDAYYATANLLKNHEELKFDYLSEFHGTDFEIYMELYAHLYSYRNNQSITLKVKIDRDQPEIDSLVPLWAGAEWPECETYDLLGIMFKGHPNLHRILLGEDWVGYPLRKDYVSEDVEV